MIANIGDFLGISKKIGNSIALNKPEIEIPISELKQDLQHNEEKLQNSKLSYNSIQNNLEVILQTRARLRQRKSEEITFSKPIISWNDLSIIFPNTINLIQGQAGSHKSRIAELLMSVMLKLMNCHNTHLGFTANQETRYTGVYVDTERNLNEQFPYALQQIQMQAGYYRSDNPENFDFISLLEISRKERFATLSVFLEKIRQEHQNHVFIVLDVVSDCIEDFNRTDDSMQLTDMLNMMINRYNVTFLCVIHENPSSNNKAGGHLGTELMNKASTVMQVGFETNSDNSPSHIIRLKYLKCRSTERPEPLHIIFNKETRQLELADDCAVNEVFENRKSKAPESDVIDHLSDMVESFPISKKQLITDLEKWLDTSSKTIEERLKSIVEGSKVLFREGVPYTLIYDGKQGRNVMLNIKPLENHE